MSTEVSGAKSTQKNIVVTPKGTDRPGDELEERAVSKGLFPFMQPHTQSVSLTNSYCPDNGDVKQTNITDDVDKAYRSTATVEQKRVILTRLGEDDEPDVASRDGRPWRSFYEETALFMRT